MLVVEEFSQISAVLWNDIAKLSQKLGQFILLGDPGQLEPIKNTWAGCQVNTMSQRATSSGSWQGEYGSPFKRIAGPTPHSLTSALVYGPDSHTNKHSHQH